MAAKSEKNTGGKSNPKPSKETPKKTSSKSKKELEENDEDDEELDDDTVSPKGGLKNSAKTSGKKGKDEDDEDDDADDVEVVDDWDKPEEEEEWDPDFEEFDLPKSKVKKTGGVKKGKGDDDELGIDEEFKDLDLFNDRGLDDDEDDF